MSSDNPSLKPVKLYSHASGPNSWKVAMVLKALKVPYTEEFLEFDQFKKEPYISVNPNGRVPSIEDPNTGISGQGPYFGQAAWFSVFHHEKLPSAVARYVAEIKRVIGVIDRHLEHNHLKYLVSESEHPEGRLTFCDMAFVTWAVAGEKLLSGSDEPLFADGKNQAYKAWLDRVIAHPAVKETLEEWEKKKQSH